MSPEFRDMLYFFGAASCGKEYKPDHEINIDAIMKIASDHGVWQTVYLGLKANYDVSAYEEEFLTSVMWNISRNDFVNNCINKLEQNGIECCYLKGITVAGLYAQPDCRISSDTDILVPKDSFSAVASAFEADGFEVEKLKENLYHIEAFSPIGGIVELHVDLYQRQYKDMLFGGKVKMTEPMRKAEICGKSITALGINDGLNHLTSHYIKHFVSKGVGVRQLMDLLLYMVHYNDQIDWHSYNALWQELEFDSLIEKLKGIGAKYFGLEFDSYSTDYIDDILNDIESGGIFGYGVQDRRRFVDVFFEARCKNNREELKEYMDDVVHDNLKNATWFPSTLILSQQGYGYATKNKLCYTVACVHRLFDVSLSYLNGKRKLNYKVRTAANDAESQRLELMKKIGLIK